MAASIQSITQELSDSSGFKKYFKGGFGKHAKTAEAMWNGAEARGVFPVVPIADFSTLGVTNIVYAFAIQDGALTDAAISTIAERAKTLTPDQIKAEDRNYTIGFAPLIAPPGHPANKKGDALALVPHLGDGIKSVRTFLHSALYLNDSDKPTSGAAVVLYVRQGGADYIKVLTLRGL